MVMELVLLYFVASMKAKSTNIIMMKVPPNYSGISYAPIDKAAEDVLGNRNSFEVKIPVRGRSLPQNSLWAVWYNQIGKELGQTPAEIKAECKLIYGVPILRAEDEEFRELYDRAIKPLDYDTKLQLMNERFKVTSLFSKHQGIVYQETLQREYAKMNIILEVL